jgi:hypothetical protein
VIYGDEQEAVLEEQTKERGMNATQIGADNDANDFTDTDVLMADDFDNADVEADVFSEKRVDDFIGEGSIVFDVEELVAEFEAESEGKSNSSSKLRKRLEALAERKRRNEDLMDFKDYDIEY